MNADLENLLIMVIGAFFVGTTGSALAILWSRIVRQAWPDRDTMIGLAKVFYGIGALGIVMYLFLKYA
jgi:hypothetical protein